jgi:hypothetical protein
VYVLFAAGKRTPIAVSAIAVLLYFYKIGIIKDRLKYFAFFVVLIAALSFNINSIQVALNEFWNNFYKGVFNILGNTEVRDTSGSAILRYEARQWAYDYITSKFNFFNYIFGAGYMTRWLDNSILQAYLDMGIIGFIFYIRLVIVFPVKIMSNKNINLIVLFAAFFCLYHILCATSSGNPYLYINFTSIVLLAFCNNLQKT